MQFFGPPGRPVEMDTMQIHGFTKKTQKDERTGEVSNLQELCEML